MDNNPSQSHDVNLWRKFIALCNCRRGNRSCLEMVHIMYL